MKTQELAVETADAPLLRDEHRLKQQCRAQRLAALEAIAGIWKDRTDIPKDGVEFQRALRAEWD